jgi:predicted PurR-regulated permease PerM
VASFLQKRRGVASITQRDPESTAKPEGTSHRTIRFEVAPKTIALVLLAFASVWLFLRLVPVLLVLVVALFLVGTLNPLVEALEKRGFKRRTGIAIVFISVLVTVVVLAAITLPPLASQATRFIEHAPQMRDKAVTLLARSRITLPLANSLAGFRGIAINDGAAALEFSYRAAAIIGYGVSSIFLSLYLMLDRDRVRGALFAFVPRKHHIRLSRILIKLETIVGGYIRGQVVTSALMTLFTFVLLMIAGVDGAVALAVFAGLADVLPYIGVFLSVGPAVIATLAHGAVLTLVVLGAMLVYEELESRVLVPRIYGRALRLPSSMVILALLAGGTIGGILGALLALPVAAVIRMLMREISPEMPGEDDAYEGDVRDFEQRAQSEYELRADGMDAKHAAAVALEITTRGERHWGSMAPL